MDFLQTLRNLLNSGEDPTQESQTQPIGEIEPNYPPAPVTDFTKNVLFKGVPQPLGPGVDTLPPIPMKMPEPLIQPVVPQTPKPSLDELQTVSAKVKDPIGINRNPGLQQEPTKEDVPQVDEVAELFKNINAHRNDQDEELKALQLARSNELRDNAMLRGFNEVGSAIAGVKPTKDYLKDYDTIANQKVDDLMTRKKDAQERTKTDVDMAKSQLDMTKAKMQLDNDKEKNNPNSEISKAARESVRQRFALTGVKVKVPDGLSFSQLTQIYPASDIVDDLLKMETQKELKLQRKEDKEKANQDKKDVRTQTLTNQIRDKLYQVDKDVKYTEALSNYNNLKDRLAGGKFNSIDDVRAVYSLMKSLDPGSVVRETEFETLASKQGGFNQIMQAPQRFFKGDMFNSEFRKKLIENFGNVVKSREDQIKQSLSPYLNEAQRQNIPTEYILPSSVNTQTKPQSYNIDQNALQAELKRRNLK